jgi:hypothetical protein
MAPRPLLLAAEPDRKRALSTTATSRVLSWFSLRYGRPAWPNNFEARLRSAKADLVLREILGPLKDDLAEVRIAIVPTDAELADGTPYKVGVYFVVDEPIWLNDAQTRSEVHDAFARFVSIIDKCNGIDVDMEVSGVASGGEFTWQMAKATDEWNFANLSQAE